MKTLLLLLILIPITAQASAGWIYKDWKPTIRAGSIPNTIVMAEEITDPPEEEATIEELPEETPGEKEQLPEENPASQTDLEPIETVESPATVENEQENSSEQSETTEDSPVEIAGEEEKEEINHIEAIS